MSNSQDTQTFPVKRMVGDIEIVLNYDKAQNDFSWECGEQGGVGFSSLDEAEVDALFWTAHGREYLYMEQISKGY